MIITRSVITFVKSWVLPSTAGTWKSDCADFKSPCKGVVHQNGVFLKHRMQGSPKQAASLLSEQDTRIACSGSILNASPQIMNADNKEQRRVFPPESHVCYEFYC